MRCAIRQSALLMMALAAVSLGHVLLAGEILHAGSTADSGAQSPEGGGSSDVSSGTRTTASKDNATAKPASLTDDEEAAALAFATEHHPQLASLARRLKQQNPDEYANALREIAQASEQINRWQERQPARYQIELDLWKVESRIRLLAARIAMEDRPAFDKELRGLLNERVDLRIALMNVEKDRIRLRLEKLEDSVRQTDKDRTATVERELERLLRQVRSQTTRQSPKPAPVTKDKNQTLKPSSGTPEKRPAHNAGTDDMT